jgi:hypothetical protein
MDFGSSLLDNKEYKILVLKKPHEAILELEEVGWKYPSSKVIYLYNVLLGEIYLTSLDFSWTFIKDEGEKIYSFSRYTSLRKIGEYILISSILYGVDESDKGRNTNCVAVLDLTGKLIGLWHFESNFGYQLKILDFIPLSKNLWLINLGICESKKMMSDKDKNLYLLTTNRNKGFKLDTSFKDTHNSIMNHNLNSDGVTCLWYSEKEIDSHPEFLVFCSTYHLCVYRYENNNSYARYKKIMETMLADYYLTKVKVKLNVSELFIEFESNQDTRKGVFTLRV